MIHPDSYWTHKREGYEVQVSLEENLKTKDADSANWHPAISYLRTDEEDSPTYVRTTADFLAKFEEQVGGI